MKRVTESELPIIAENPRVASAPPRLPERVPALITRFSVIPYINNEINCHSLFHSSSERLLTVPQMVIRNYAVI